MEGTMKEGKFVETKGIMDEMRAKGLKPHYKVLELLLTDAVMRRDAEAVDNWLREMRSQQGTKLNFSTYASVLVRAEAQGDRKVVEEWVERMRKDGMKMNIVLYNDLIGAAIRGDSVVVWHWHEAMERDDHPQTANRDKRITDSSFR
jgi:hypothetical protein